MVRPLASVLALALLAGCDASAPPPASPVAPTGPATLHAADGSWTVTVREGGAASFAGDADGRVDAVFDARALLPGRPLRAAGATAALSSTPRADGRHVLTYEPASPRARVQGVRDGRVVVDRPSADGRAGVATAGPTSVHRRWICRDGSCAEVVEYDYDNVATGATPWTPPDDADAVAVDRVRVVSPAGPSVPAAPSPLVLEGFAELVVLGQ